MSVGVLDRYTSGLALQATSETVDAFGPRLQAELTSWLRYAPNLVRRAISSPSTESLSLSDSSSAFQNPNNFQCSTLLINTDTSTVDVSIEVVISKYAIMQICVMKRNVYTSL